MSEISVIVHDPVPHDTAPITADEMKGSLEALGYHVRFGEDQPVRCLKCSE